MIAFIKTYSGTLKTIFVCLLVGLVIWFFVDWKNLKEDKARQDENWRQEQMEDSIKYKALELSKDQINDYLHKDRKDLLEVLKAAQIKTNRIESIITQMLTYRDTSRQTTDLSPIIDAIKINQFKELPFEDSTKCLVIKGNLRFDSTGLKLNVTSRDFKNKTDVVAYWERKQWKFLFFKTRFLGKKQFTAKSFSECGEVGTVKIQKSE